MIVKFVFVCVLSLIGTFAQAREVCSEIKSIPFQFNLNNQPLCIRVLPSFLAIANKINRSVDLDCINGSIQGTVSMRGDEIFKNPGLAYDYKIPVSQPLLEQDEAELVSFGVSKFSNLVRAEISPEVFRYFEGWVVRIH